MIFFPPIYVVLEHFRPTVRSSPHRHHFKTHIYRLTGSASSFEELDVASEEADLRPELVEDAGFTVAAGRGAVEDEAELPVAVEDAASFARTAFL